MVLMELTFSLIKDDNVYEENDHDVFQSEGKYQWFFDGLYKLQLFNDLKMWSRFSIGREITMVF